MASFFRSISTRVFGVAVGLALLVAASLLSATLTTHVHRQLGTLSQSLFPLAVTLGELRSSILAERVGIDARDRSAAGDAACLRIAETRSGEGDRLIARARALRELGVKLAVLEQNRLTLARLEALIEDVDREHHQLDALILRQCAATPGTALARQINAETNAHTDELRRKVRAVTGEIATFVEQGGTIVEANQALALRANMALIAVAGMAGLLLVYLVAGGLTAPIGRLRAGAHEVQSGKLDGEAPVTSVDEIGDVTHAFNHTVEGLRSRERIKETFGQYVDPRAVAELAAGSAERLTAGEKQVATLYFSDLTGFASIAERLAPSTLVALVNAYFSEMSRPIRERQGIIDKYIGDGIMAFWTPPFTEAGSQAALACAAALEQIVRLEAFRKQASDIIGLRRDAPDIQMRIGISTGEVVAGSIGSEIARSFTVLGDTVNLGSRLENANKAYGTQVLIDGATRDMAGAAIEAREVDLVGVVGRAEPIRIFELAALGGWLGEDQRALFEVYASGLARYRAGDWDAADRALREALALAPGDGPSTTMLQRTAQFRREPPAAWDGIWRLTSK